MNLESTIPKGSMGWQQEQIKYVRGHRKISFLGGPVCLEEEEDQSVIPYDILVISLNLPTFLWLYTPHLKDNKSQTLILVTVLSLNSKVLVIGPKIILKVLGVPPSASSLG